MDTVDVRGRIVVGTDGSGSAQVAVDWAAGRAVQRGRSLLIVWAVPEMSPGGQLTTRGVLSPDVLSSARAEAGRRLENERERVLQRFPGLDVAAELVAGRPAEVLVQASKRAELVVVGARGRHSSLTAQVLGGVSDAVATHAHGLVAVVPETTHAGQTGPVVVGVVDVPEAVAAVRVAIAEAVARNVPLVALNAWDLGFVDINIGRLKADLTRMLDDILSPLLVGPPGLTVEKRVVLGRPADALLDASDGAVMVVVGSRGQEGFLGLRLGSTSRAVLRTSRCPVLVARQAPPPSA